jgi:outer membrane receptor protein involved in Fe transport
LKHGIQGRLDFDLTLGERLLLQFGLGTYFDMTYNRGSGEFWTIDYDDSQPVYRKIAFENEAPDNQTLTSFLYINSNLRLVPDLLTFDLGLRVDHSYLIGEGFDLNTYPVPGPRLSIQLTPPWENSFLLSNTFSVGVGLFSKTPFETIQVTEEMGLEDFDVTIPKTLMTLLGWETRMPFGFRFRLEGYYKYIFDRFYSNNVVDDETGEIDTIIHNDGIGHAAGFDFLLDKKTSRYVDGLLSYSFIFARYYNPVSDGIESSSAPREQWYYPSFHRFNTLNLLINLKPFGWMTFTTKLSFATGPPKTEFGDKEMFAGLFEEEDGTTTVAEMYSRKSLYSDTLRRNISLPLDVKLTLHDYFINSKLRWEFYIAVEDVLSPLLYELLPRDTVNTSMWTGEDQPAPSSAFAIPIPSIGFRISL